MKFLYLCISGDYLKFGITHDVKTRLGHYISHNPNVFFDSIWEGESAEIQNAESLILKELGCFKRGSDWLKCEKSNVDKWIKFLNLSFGEGKNFEGVMTDKGFIKARSGWVKGKKSKPYYYENQNELLVTKTANQRLMDAKKERESMTESDLLKISYWENMLKPIIETLPSFNLDALKNQLYDSGLIKYTENTRVFGKLFLDAIGNLGFYRTAFGFKKSRKFD